ncbi:RING-H2 finger protein ATL51-like [Mercurialis annua]|uniref:RING-H2 finger protein ATL51-like n=1 Tax=Mercurialis annua TaxID=3986 RepID=UPI002160043D|nr:RING-H2 finger protein ATL51-like [Mercurialis annua]
MSNTLGGSDGNGDDVSNKVTVLLIGIGSAALVVTIYHCLAMGWCNRDRTRPNAQQLPNGINNAQENPSVENSASQLIPAFKYQKGMALEGGGEEETCPICLSEFEDGEDLRALPECLHAYHLACIDMWLYSHLNCPVCRTDAVSPHILWRTMEVGSETSNIYRDLGVLQNIVVQSRAL